MNSILITGCNRGIGLGLIKAFAAKSLHQPNLPKYIFATCRNVEKATVRYSFSYKMIILHFSDFY